MSKDQPDLQKQLIDKEDEEWKAFEKLIGIQLKYISQNQRIFTCKLISDVIFYAKMGQLWDYSYLFMKHNIYDRLSPGNVKQLVLLRYELSEQEQREEWEAYEKFIVSQLNGINPIQRIITYKLISDVIFYAKMGQLSENSHLFVEHNVENREKQQSYEVHRRLFLDRLDDDENEKVEWEVYKNLIRFINHDFSTRR